VTDAGEPHQRQTRGSGVITGLWVKRHRGQEWFCTHVMLDTVVVKGEGREDGQSLHCQLKIALDPALAFKAGSDENARMKEAEASLD